MLATRLSGPSRPPVTFGEKNNQRTKRKMTHEEQARFAKASAEFVTGLLAKETATNLPSLVTKAQIIYVLGPGYSVAQVDRKRAQDVEFPKPINDCAHLLQWRLKDLLEYLKKKIGA